MTYSKIVIEIADILFAQPTIKMSEVVSMYVNKCQRTDRTVNRWIRQAKEYNKERIEEQERVKDEVIHSEITKATQAAVLNREQVLVILSDIAKGEAREVHGEVIVPTDSERIRAAQTLVNIHKWDSESYNYNAEDKNKAVIANILGTT